MSDKGVTATELLMQDTARLLQSLRDEDWQAPSAATGWRVQDVIVHMAAFCNTISDPDMPRPANPPATAERLNDAMVDERRGWSAAQALDYYQTQSVAGLATLRTFQSPEYADATIPLAELGTYHLSELSNAMAFDHFVHLSSDLLQPYGPLDRPAVAPDEDRLEPTLDWMLAGLPNMCADALRAPLTRPLGFELTGPAARSFTVAWSDGAQRLTVTGTGELPGDVVRSSTFAFTRWATTRSNWREEVEISGDRDYVAGVLDAINVV